MPSPLLAFAGRFDAAVQRTIRMLVLDEIPDIEIATLNGTAKTIGCPELVLIGGYGSYDEIHEIIQHSLDAFPATPRLFVTSSGSEMLAVSCLRAGMQDYFSAPFDWDALIAAVKRLLPRPKTKELRLAGAESFVGSSDTIVSLKQYISRVAPSPSNVLITGETGTGKDVVANLIHKNSTRSAGNFVDLNCAAIPDGLFESELFGYERGAFTGANARHQGKLQMATGGTVFLDEVGDMSLVAQAKLLRAIETKQAFPLGSKSPVSFDVRVIAATNQGLETLVEEKRFRKDLYFRLNVARIQLLPLRERVDDIPEIADRFIHDFNRSQDRKVSGFSPIAMDCMMRYSWPGNVRELRNVVESAFLMSHSLRLEMDALPEHLHMTSKPLEVSGTERTRLVNALRETEWNKSETARRLQWSRMTVYRKMVKYELLGDVDTDAEDM